MVCSREVPFPRVTPVTRELGFESRCVAVVLPMMSGVPRHMVCIMLTQESF